MEKILEADDYRVLFYKPGKVGFEGWITGTMDTYMDTDEKGATSNGLQPLDVIGSGG